MGAQKLALGVLDGQDSTREVRSEPNPDTIYRNAAPRDKPYKIADGDGMYLLVQPNGAKYWRLKYRHVGKEGVYAIGVYPDVTLADARVERGRARGWLRDGKDPMLERKAAKAMAAADQTLTFKAMAEEWYAEKSPGWSEAHRQAQRSRLDVEILPYIGALPIKDVKPMHVLELLDRIYKRGAQEVVAKCRVIISHVFRHAVAPAGLESNPVDLLRGRFARTNPVVHRRRVAAEEMPALFKALHEVPAEDVTKLALYFLMLTAARTGEMRFAEWREIENGKGGKIWRIAGKRMKMDREHVVPLSTQAVEILDRAKPMRTSKDPGALIFPGFTRVGHGGLSENALLALLARAGFFGRQTSHGFRGSFSTWAHEVAEANPDVIELCLAHVAGDIRGVYNDAKYLTQRRALLQQWADQCSAWGMKLP